MKTKQLGKIVTSATGLRKMANILQKKYKIKGNVEVEAYLSYYTKSKKKTIGILIGSK